MWTDIYSSVITLSCVAIYNDTSNMNDINDKQILVSINKITGTLIKQSPRMTVLLESILVYYIIKFRYFIKPTTCNLYNVSNIKSPQIVMQIIIGRITS